MAVKKLKNFSCPFCGGTEFVKGRAIDQGRAFIAPLQYKRKLLDFHIITQLEIRVYCKNCGSLVRTYIQHPEMLDHNQE